MDLETQDIIEQPLDVVYNLVRDDLPKIVPYLPNIKKIEVKHFAHKGSDFTETVNHWYAKAEIPLLAQKFIKEELLSWKDTAIWHNKDHFVEYQLESFWAKEIYEAKGKNFFVALGPNRTQLRVTCKVIIHPDKIPGVPTFLVKKILPTIEPLIQKILQPNLSGLGKGLNEYFSKNK